jgi:diguanylate cyclase (GGDEF)-like protein
MTNPLNATREGAWPEPQFDDREQVAFLLLLFSADSLPELVRIADRHIARRWPGARVAMFWTNGEVDNGGVAQRRFAPESVRERINDAAVIAALSGVSSDGLDSARREWFIALGGLRPQTAAAVWLSDSAEQPIGEGNRKMLADTLRWRSRELLERDYLAISVERLEKAQRLQHALYAIADLASSDLEMAEMLQSIHSIVGELMYAENFYIALLDESGQRMRFIYFADTVDTLSVMQDKYFSTEEMRNSITLALMRHGKTMRGPSESVREALGVTRDAFQGTVANDWLGVPLVSGGKVHGAVVVQSYQEEVGYTEEDAALLGYVAQHILTALQRKQAHDDLEDRVEARTRELKLEIAERERGERLQAAFLRIAELASTAETIDGFYRGAHAVVGELLYAKNFYVAIAEDENMLSFPYAIDERDPLAKFEPRKRGLGLTEYVIRTGKPLRADRAQLDDLYQKGEARTVGALSVCWLGVPLRGESGLLGAIAVQSYTETVMYSERDQEMLTFVAHHIALSLERKRAQESLKLAYADLELRVQSRTHELGAANVELREQIRERERMESQLKHEALHDMLTGLPNRALLLNRLEHALARFRRDMSHMFSVLFLDLDRFKIINDSVGHLVGDELLKEAGARIRACLREEDLVARLGGDEFAVLLEDIESDEDAPIVARRVIAALNEPIRVEGKELFTSASIGIAYSHARYQRAEELLRDSDVAMYRAKSLGRQRYEVFDERLHREALALLDLEGDLRRALAREEFEPYFQTICDLRTGAIIGYEALLRWHHPDRGLLLPGDFLKVAEENGSAEMIDWQVFHRVMKVVPQVCAGGRYVTINVSARHFRDADLSDNIISMLKTHDVRPEQVRIEVTEGALLENPEQIRSILDALSEHGVLALLDDFGTGYSSLSYLHQFPMHSLKIDRSFVADLDPSRGSGKAAVVRAIIALAHSLGVEVIGEGIEQSVQRQALIELGCMYGQGFLFSDPRPASALLL